MRLIVTSVPSQVSHDLLRIAKNFANALSLILTVAISFAFFDFTINFGVTAGILIVIASTFSFNTDMPSFAKPRRKDEVEEKETRYHASV